MLKKKQKVFVGLSGGVDSSVSAALLQRAGYDVTGVFIKTWSPDWLPCTWRDERRDAMRVAAHLAIPFLTFDFEEVYKKNVVDNLLDEYRQGRTPNPDVLCNREVKFGAFLDEALRQGADLVATGHYARITHENNMYHLREGIDATKDQSYFLWMQNQKTLARTLFPVGHLQKREVRALAKKFGLSTAAKKDSQGICFLGPVDMKEFLAHYVPRRPGDVLDRTGRVIGRHAGAMFFTLGERHGFTLIDSAACLQPQYVVAKDIAANTLTVAPHQHGKDTNAAITVELTSSSWTTGQPPLLGTIYKARFRYRQDPQPCQIVKLTANQTKINFERPQENLSAGQSLVLYANDECLGGGILI